VKILVVGAGATGGYFGAQLIQAGREVTFLARPRRAAQLQERGLRLIGLGETKIIAPTVRTAAELDDPYDVVLLSVKATALNQALKDLAPAVGPSTALIPFLNGIAHLDTLNAHFGEKSVLGGVIKVVTTIDGNGDILRLAPLASLTLGEQDGQETARTRALAELFAVDGFGFSISSDIMTAMWHKWVFIATAGALTCLMRGTVGDIVSVDGGDLARTLLAETSAVSAAAGFPLAVRDFSINETTFTQPGSTFASSMYRDVVNGLPTEVEHILGDLLARARALGIDTPMLDLATKALRVYEKRIARA
jgi:2-dehydropantoate 2-reductase